VTSVATISIRPGPEMMSIWWRFCEPAHLPY
jgi:hypothetical protein